MIVVTVLYVPAAAGANNSKSGMEYAGNIHQ
jgi:hypothetical protein